MTPVSTSAKSPLRGRLRDVGAEPVGDEVVLPVGHDLGDDRRVPGAAGGGDPTGDVVGEDRRAGSAAATSAAAAAGTGRSSSRRSVGMELAPAMTLNRMYHWAPSAIRTIPPKFRLSPIATEHDDGEREQEVRREAGEDLHDRLGVAGQPRAHADLHADRHPDQRRDDDEDDDPAEREEPEAEACAGTGRDAAWLSRYATPLYDAEGDAARRPTAAKTTSPARRLVGVLRTAGTRPARTVG